MKGMIAIFAGLVPAFSAVVGHGPIVHWNQDPAKSCQIVWLERSGQSGVEGKWSTGPAGFGYGDDDDATVLPYMKGRFLSIAIRRKIEIPAGVPGDAVLVLRVNYDDGFIGWLGGKEIVSRNIAGAGGRAAGIHEAGDWEDFRLGRVDKWIGGQGAVLALQGFNNDLGSSDFTLHPVLVAKSGREEWTLSAAGDPWEYLANAEPDEGWQNTLAAAAAPGAASPPEFSIRHRVKGGGGAWIEGKVSSAPFAGSAHRVLRAELKALSNDRDIEFEITRGGMAGAGNFVFRMPPAKEQTVRFVTGGDLYHSRKPMDQMNRVAGARDPLFALIGGDLAYANDGSHDRWFDYIDSWAANARTPDGRLVPKVVAIGNHEIKGAGYHPTDAPGAESASMFYSIFTFPDGSNATHCVDFGGWLGIVNLDSGHTRNIADQTAWLEAALQQRTGFPNLFVCYHRPAWGAGVKPDAVDIQREWCPLFEKHRVTAVFENDHHVFSRSHPILGGKIDHENGIPYLGSGSWSVGARKVDPKELKKRPWIAKAEGRNHLYVIETLAHGYTAAAVDLEGVEFDRSERTWQR
jgi:hypothetical protein